MTSFSQRITSADFDTYLKRDPIYQEKQQKYHSRQEQLQRHYSWVRALDGWTGSSNLLTRIIGFVALFFAKIHDRHYQKEIHEAAKELAQIEWSILKETGLTQEKRLTADYDRDSPENQEQFTAEALSLRQVIADQWTRFADNPKAATTALAMMHQGGYVDHMHTAIQMIEKEYGIDVVLVECNGENSKVRSSNGITFVRHFNILLTSHPTSPLGTLRIDGNYVFSTESGQVNYQCDWNPEQLADAQRITMIQHYVDVLE